MTTLIDAIKKKNFTHAIALINSRRLNIDEPDSEGRTPLWWAVKHNAKEVVSQLLVKGASIYAQSKTGVTPFTLVYREYDKSKHESHFEILEHLFGRWYDDIQKGIRPIDHQEGMDGTLL